MPSSALTNKKLVGARDPLGIRPLVIGKLDGCPILASETCALDIIGAQIRARRRERRGRGLRRGRRAVAQAVPADAGAALHLRIHLFLAAGFHRRRPPASTTCARPWARELAREAPANADVIVPVPDSGVPAAIGFAQAAGIPYELGIIRNHYVGRTFIQPTQSIRDSGRAPEALRQPRGGRRQAHRAGRRFASCAAPPRARSCR